MNSFEDKIQSLKEAYIKLGGSADYFDENVIKKLKLNPITLKQSINAHREEISRPYVSAAALELFFDEIFQRVIFHRHPGLHALESAVLRFQFPIAPKLGNTQTTELRFPFVITG